MAKFSRREVQVTHALGFHLRAAGRFVHLSRQFQATIRVCCDGRGADGRSILDLMLLTAECGARLELEAIGPDAEEATALLAALVEQPILDDEAGRDA
ncbi:MAG: HPr family phosphocarrier protein [Isosphaeraceae bacterium]